MRELHLIRGTVPEAEGRIAVKHRVTVVDDDVRSFQGSGNIDVERRIHDVVLGVNAADTESRSYREQQPRSAT